MRAKRSQGLPIDAIIIAILAILVLIGIAYWWFTTSGKQSSLQQQVSPTDFDMFKIKCQQYKTNLLNSLNGGMDPGMVEKDPYCTYSITYQNKVYTCMDVAPIQKMTIEWKGTLYTCFDNNQCGCHQ